MTMRSMIGIILITVYILLVIKGSHFLKEKEQIKEETNRKLVHVLLSFCFFLAHYFFKTTMVAIILPLVFVIINMLSSKLKWFKNIKREDQDLGIVWYAISLLVLVYISFEQKDLFPIASCSVLVLGLSDAVAGLIGTRWGKHTINVKGKKKTLEGSLAFFITSSIIFLVILKDVFPITYVEISIITASLTMMIERFSTQGLDNVTVPLSTMFILLLLKYISFDTNNLFIASILMLLGDYCYQTNKLTLPGVIVALILGFMVETALGTVPFLALCTFLFSSTILSKIRTNRTKATKNPERRGAKQVVANGILAFLFALCYKVTNHQVWVILFFITIASSTSDTWSGEIGMMGNEPVKSIITRKKLEKGLSGGVTKLGFLGALLGSLTIASFYLIVDQNIITFLIITLLGFLSSVIDSILGDLCQIKYYDKENKKIQEEQTKNSIKYKGYKPFTNNTVNFLSNLSVCLIYYFIAKLI